MFRVFLLAALPAAASLSAIGCDEYFVVPEPQEAVADCVATEVTHTRVPSTLFGGIYVTLLCTECDVDECNSLGARCDVEGEACDFYGKLGVCRGCCDSEFGELHCALVDQD